MHQPYVEAVLFINKISDAKNNAIDNQLRKSVLHAAFSLQDH